MLSESARMSSAAEARFRIDGPPAPPRAVTVIALDAHSEPLVASLAGPDWHGATFHAFAEWDGVNGQLAREIDLADHVVVVATAGEPAAGAAAIGAVCSRRRIGTTGLVLGSAEATDAALAATLATLRPWMLMLVLTNSEDFVADMLRALRA